ncbi:1-acyl-sn-glycerol-3-phosphate acyltransferase [hydrothermal vent metagenome]|uniref:1-acyl-sn-glycerol-3-phosphate acyltransferase n=1 Tax=hydrothermal vent metagenome TaxID=652676 RepID=A0A1W1BX35_9ZZZZ
MKIFAHIRWLYATIVIFLGLILSIILFPVFKAPRSQKIAARFIKALTNFDIEVEGKEDPKAQMFLINHQSDLDIEVIELISNKELAWVAKKELFEVPFFGLAMKLPEHIAVDRKDKKSLLKLLKDAKDRLDKGKTLAIFPEGTRSKGEKMLPFKNGAKLIADKYALRVQPIVLIGTRNCFDIKSFTYNPGIIKAIFLDSFIADKDDENWLKDLREKMQETYNHNSTITKEDLE